MIIDYGVPAMIHVSTSCNANFHTTGAHYLNADTAAFMQCLLGDLFNELPTLRFVIPHGGGAVPDIEAVKISPIQRYKLFEDIARRACFRINTALKTTPTNGE